MGLNHGSLEIVTDGLVLCLDAANSRSYPGAGTVWTDLAGTGNGALANGPAFIAGNLGSIYFDGSDDYVDLGSAFSNYSVFTISFWINYIDLGGNHESPVGDDSQQYNYLVLFFGGSFYLGVSSSQGGTGNSSGGISHGTMVNGEWYNFVITKDSSSLISLYKNSLFLGSTTKTGGVNVQWIGRGFTYDNCKISMFQLYNRAISAGEVLQNYEATVGRYI